MTPVLRLRTVLVRVKAAGINISEAVIRTEAVAATFPGPLGVAAERIDTIADYAGAQKHGVKTDGAQRPGRAPRCSPNWPA